MPSAAHDIEIRPATRADLPIIVALLADDVLGATREQATDPLPPEYRIAFDAIEAQVGNEILVAVLDDHVVGCLQLTVIPGLSRQGMLRGQIDGVRISSAHRGRRIGEQLVTAAIERARAQGCALMQLTTDRSRADARRFYERLGFIASHVGMKLGIETA